MPFFNNAESPRRTGLQLWALGLVRANLVAWGEGQVLALRSTGASDWTRFRLAQQVQNLSTLFERDCQGRLDWDRLLPDIQAQEGLLFARIGRDEDELPADRWSVAGLLAAYLAVIAVPALTRVRRWDRAVDITQRFLNRLLAPSHRELPGAGRPGPTRLFFLAPVLSALILNHPGTMPEEDQ